MLLRRGLVASVSHSVYLYRTLNFGLRRIIAAEMTWQISTRVRATSINTYDVPVCAEYE